MGTAFDCDGLVNDVTLDTRARRQAHFQAAYTSDDAAIDDNIVRDHFALDRSGFADCQQMRANVAFHCALNLNVTGGFHITGHMQICRQN